MKIDFDPKVFYGIIAVVVVVAAFLVYRGATAQAVAPLPDAKMFIKSGPATSSIAPSPSTRPSSN
jgi:hypothetical protein